MRHLRVSILLATLYLVVHTLGPVMGFPESIMLVLLALAPVVVVALVIHILKHGKPSVRRWSEGHFYDDVDIRSVLKHPEPEAALVPVRSQRPGHNDLIDQL